MNSDKINYVDYEISYTVKSGRKYVFMPIESFNKEQTTSCIEFNESTNTLTINAQNIIFNTDNFTIDKPKAK